MTAAYALDEDDAPDRLGPFDAGVRLWAKMIAIAPPDQRPAVFHNCVAEGATFISKGAPRGLIADALVELANRHRLVDALGGREAVESSIAEGLAEPRQSANGQDKSAEADPQPEMLERLELGRYDVDPIPEREWGVRDRFPRRNVALLSGEGAIGKSILLLQLAVAHVLGRDWLRSMPEPGPVLLVNCEDDGPELLRRLQPILASYHAKFADVDTDLHAFSLAHRDPLLAVADRGGRIVPTPLYNELLERARTVKPICTMIDNVADVFGGNEIDRSQVRQFVALMRQIALVANGYVIMSSHPSLSGITSKSGLSGSTQWHNSMRARAYMHMLSEKDAENITGTRVLEFMKSNYSALSEQIELQWSNGLYLPLRIPTGPEQATRNAAADALFLVLLDKATGRDENLSPKRNANNYAPTVFAGTAEAKAARLTVSHFADALDRLVTAGKVASEPYGAASRDTKRIVRRGLF